MLRSLTLPPLITSSNHIPPIHTKQSDSPESSFHIPNSRPPQPMAIFPCSRHGVQRKTTTGQYHIPPQFSPCRQPTSASCPSHIPSSSPVFFPGRMFVPPTTAPVRCNRSLHPTLSLHPCRYNAPIIAGRRARGKYRRREYSELVSYRHSCARRRGLQLTRPGLDGLWRWGNKTEQRLLTRLGVRSES